MTSEKITSILDLSTTTNDRIAADRDPRVRYALAVLLGLPVGEDLAWPNWLCYGDIEDMSSQRGVQIVPSGFFAEAYGSPDSLPRPPLAEIGGVPLLYGKPLVERRGNVLAVQADILASAYFLLARYEEWVRRDVRDEHGRFPGIESLPYREKFIHRPIVDEYAELLRGWAKEVGIDLPPPRRQFSILLTHDVDVIGTSLRPLQPLRSLLSAALGRQSWNQALCNAAVAMKWRADPADNIEELIRLDRSLVERTGTDCCRVVYFFQVRHQTPLDANYDLRSPKVRGLLDLIRASGAEIGLHASYAAGEDPRLLADERAELEQVGGMPIIKNRHHFLRWREPEQGAVIAAAGIAWDSTLGYADVAGFRLGVCHQIPLFDPAARRLLEIEEHPLVMMDCSFSTPKYMNLTEEAAFDSIRGMADVTSRYGGELALLWHNHMLAPYAGYHAHLYPRILTYLADLLSRAR